MEITEEERQQIKEKVEKLKASRFKQQMLPAWRPVPSFGSTMIIFAIFGLVFLLLGIVLYIMSDKIQEVSYQSY
jgi:preprotein translocase subunit SecF